MSYYIALLAADFAIPLDRGDEALRHVGPLHRKVYGKDPDSIEAVFRDLAWPLRRARSSWRMTRGPAVKHAWEEQLFEDIAPCVADGSFIRSEDEDGDEIAWFFSHGECNTGREEIEVGRTVLTVPRGELTTATTAVVSRFSLSLALAPDVTLGEVFEDLGWTTAQAPDGGLALVGKQRSQLAQVEERVLRTIARNVEAGSFVEGWNQTGESWRWLFDGGALRRSYG